MNNENNTESSSTGILIGILIVVVIAIVGWLAYSQGFFTAKQQAPQSGVQINLGGSTNAPAPATSPAPAK